MTAKVTWAFTIAEGLIGVAVAQSWPFIGGLIVGLAFGAQLARITREAFGQ